MQMCPFPLSPEFERRVADPIAFHGGSRDDYQLNVTDEGFDSGGRFVLVSLSRSWTPVSDQQGNSIVDKVYGIMGPPKLHLKASPYALP